MAALTRKVALVTGASSGIGAATALALAGEGARLVLAARRIDRLDALATRIVTEGGEAVAAPCNVADRGDVAATVEAALEAFGTIDVLVNNAGVMPLAPLRRCRFDDWDETIDVNLRGLLYCIGHVLPVMLERGSGHIVNVSSVAGRRLFPAAAVYCATKHAVHTLSEALRAELAERSAEDGNTIRVTIIAPGVVDTELPTSIRDEATRVASQAYYRTMRSPLRAEDVAASILYALTAPPHVGVNEILMRPTAQMG